MAIDRRNFIKSTAAAGAAGFVSSGKLAQSETQADGRTVTLMRTIPIRREVDVFVAGGGPSGIAASLAAARQGKTVFLAERQNCLGGMGTAGMLPVFMPFTDGINFLSGGIGYEISKRLHEAGGNGPDSTETIKSESLKRLYDEMLLEAKVDFTLETQLIEVEAKEGEIQHVVLAAKSGLFAVKAKFYIDCTGDGDLSVWAGAPFEKGDGEGNMMAGTLCSVWADIDWQNARAFGMGKQEELLPKAIEDKIFSQEDRHLPGMWRIGRNLGGGNIGHTFGVDGTDERSVTDALIHARKIILEYERYYKKYLQGYENMELVTMGAMLGIRESRRIMGDYVLCLDDFKKRAVFEDEIGRFSYPVDIHASKPGGKDYQQYADSFKNLRYGKGENYGIPYRSLLPQKLSNAYVAGRCISTDRYMQGSVRVMPGCFITGQAAGMAASIAIDKKTETRGVSVKELQQRLKAIGAYLPNC